MSLGHRLPEEFEISDGKISGLRHLGRFFVSQKVPNFNGISGLQEFSAGLTFVCESDFILIHPCESSSHSIGGLLVSDYRSNAKRCHTGVGWALKEANRTSGDETVRALLSLGRRLPHEFIVANGQISGLQHNCEMFFPSVLFNWPADLTFVSETALIVIYPIGPSEEEEIGACFIDNVDFNSSWKEQAQNGTSLRWPLLAKVSAHPVMEDLLELKNRLPKDFIFKADSLVGLTYDNRTFKQVSAPDGFFNTLANQLTFCCDDDLIVVYLHDPDDDAVLGTFLDKVDFNSTWGRQWRFGVDIEWTLK